MKTKISLGIIALVLIVGAFYYKQTTQTTDNLGNLSVDKNAYSLGLTYSTSSIVGNTATLVIPRATSSRSAAKVCNSGGADIVWVYKQGTSTGVAKGMGYPIIGTSTTGYEGYDVCYAVDKNDPYLGDIWVIPNATTTVQVEHLQS